MALRDSQRLRAFVLVLDLGSVSAAATALGYTQSAVSQQLAALERDVGATLLDRSSRPLRATPAGQALRPHAERVLSAVAAATAAVEDLRSGVERVRLAAFPSALSAFVPVAVRDLRRARPELAVQVTQLETGEAVEALRTGAADAAVVHHLPGVAVPDETGLERRHLLDDDLYVVLPEGHRLACRDAVSLADLAPEAHGLPRRDTPAGRFRSVMEHLYAQAGFEPRVVCEVDDLPAAQAFVAAGIAVGAMHGLTLSTLPAGVVARPIAERPAGTRRVEALAPAGAASPTVAELLDRLVGAARAYAPGGTPRLRAGELRPRAEEEPRAPSTG